MFLTRFTVLIIAIISVFVSGYYLPDVWAIPLFVVAASLTALGLYDLAQPLHSVRRNYPIIGHLRFILEHVRPEIRQYLIEDERDPVPFSREQRNLVYRRAKNVQDVHPFGTVANVGNPGYGWIEHSIRPLKLAYHDFRVTIGGKDCRQRYDASILNISGTSFGAVSACVALRRRCGI